jgi:hypothetical protein
MSEDKSVAEGRQGVEGRTLRDLVWRAGGPILTSPPNMLCDIEAGPLSVGGKPWRTNRN